MLDVKFGKLSWRKLFISSVVLRLVGVKIVPSFVSSLIWHALLNSTDARKKNTNAPEDRWHFYEFALSEKVEWEIR